MKVIHNIITKFMVVLFFVSISAMDSEALWMPATCLIVSGLYLLIHAYRTGAWCNSIEERDE